MVMRAGYDRFIQVIRTIYWVNMGFIRSIVESPYRADVAKDHSEAKFWFPRKANDGESRVTNLTLKKDGDHHTAIVVLRLPTADAGKLLLVYQKLIHRYADISGCLHAGDDITR